MRILFSCDEYPPLCAGGIGTATATVAENLAQKGHKIYVVSGWINDHNLPYVSKINGVVIYRIKYFNILKIILTKDTSLNKIIRGVLSKTKLLSVLAAFEWKKTVKFINRLVYDNNIDIIEMPDYNVLTNYISNKIILKYPRWAVPVVVRVHGSKAFISYYETGKIDNITLKNDYNLLASGSAVLAVSHFAAKFIHNVLLFNRKVDVIYNPMNNRFIVNPLSISRERSKEIIFIGKIVETKGAYNLIKAFNLFVEAHPDYQLIMIGDGNIKQAEAYATQKSLSHIVFTGYLTEDKIRGYLSKAAFAVIPSFFETLGQAAIEILSSGNILIYTKAATGPEIIEDGNNGFLVDPHNIQEIAEKMDYVADHIMELSSMRVKSVQNIINRFSENIIIPQLEQYYLNIIHEYSKKN